MPPSASVYTTAPLFGGAITAALPTGWIDVSTIREVPSTQEIYLSPTGLTSIIIDLCTRVSHPPSAPTDLSAFHHHLTDLIDSSTDVQAIIRPPTPVVLPRLPPYTPAYTALVTGTPRQRREGDARQPVFTALLVTLVRLEKVKTDVVVCVSVPHVLKRSGGQGEEGVGNHVEGDVDFGIGKLGGLVEEGVRVREEVERTLEVRDWGLFVDEEEDDEEGET